MAITPPNFSVSALAPPARRPSFLQTLLPQAVNFFIQKRILDASNSNQLERQESANTAAEQRNITSLIASGAVVPRSTVENFENLVPFDSDFLPEVEGGFVTSASIRQAELDLPLQGIGGGTLPEGSTFRDFTVNGVFNPSLAADVSIVDSEGLRRALTALNSTGSAEAEQNALIQLENAIESGGGLSVTEEATLRTEFLSGTAFRGYAQATIAAERMTTENRAALGNMIGNITASTQIVDEFGNVRNMSADEVISLAYVRTGLDAPTEELKVLGERLITDPNVVGRVSLQDFTNDLRATWINAGLAGNADNASFGTWMQTLILGPGNEPRNPEAAALLLRDHGVEADAPGLTTFALSPLSSAWRAAYSLHVQGIWFRSTLQRMIGQSRTFPFAPDGADSILDMLLEGYGDVPKQAAGLNTPATSNPPGAGVVEASVEAKLDTDVARLTTSLQDTNPEDMRAITNAILGDDIETTVANNLSETAVRFENAGDFEAAAFYRELSTEAATNPIAFIYWRDNVWLPTVSPLISDANPR